MIAGQIAGGRRQVVGGDRSQAVLPPQLGLAAVCRRRPSRTRTTGSRCRGCRARAGSPGPTARRCRGPRPPPARRRGGPPAPGCRSSPRGRSAHRCPAWVRRPAGSTTAGTARSRGRRGCRRRAAGSSRRDRGRAAYAVAASRSGRHGGWLQSWPFWLYGSGGAPTVIPPAYTFCSPQASAPCGFTPTARSCMMPSAIPARRPACCADASCSSINHCSQHWKSISAWCAYGEVPDRVRGRVLQVLGPVDEVRPVLLGERGPGREVLQPDPFAAAVAGEGRGPAGGQRDREDDLERLALGRPRPVPVDLVVRRPASPSA